MQVRLITKALAFEMYQELKPLAYAIAEVSGTTPAFCSALECKLFMDYAVLASHLQEGDICITINDVPLKRLTDLEIAPNNFLVSNFCARNIREAKMEDSNLTVFYHDGW